jgi:hypothetical protein
VQFGFAVLAVVLGRFVADLIEACRKVAKGVGKLPAVDK